MKIAKAAFTELFSVHPPKWSPSAWVPGVRCVFVAGNVEIKEMEPLLLEGVISGKV